MSELAVEIISAHAEGQADLFEIADTVDPLVPETAGVTMGKQATRGHHSTNQDRETNDSYYSALHQLSEHKLTFLVMVD